MNTPAADQRPLNIALIGLGKISIDQHIPAIRGNPQMKLVAGCSPRSGVDGLPCYPTLEAMLASHPEIDALAINTPPQVRFALACSAMEAGKHVLLEKPPAATVGEADALKWLAGRHGVSVLAGWHSRYAPAVDLASRWVGWRHITKVRIEWKENVRQWHPGQTWIFEAGGMGVFDPGINALSIMSALFGGRLQVKGADLYVPSNCSEPIRAELQMVAGTAVPVEASFDFLQTGQQTWSIFVTASGGETMELHLGGKQMVVNGEVVVDAPEREYARMYEHFASLVATGASELDTAPLQAVADACLLGRRLVTDAFIE